MLTFAAFLQTSYWSVLVALACQGAMIVVPLLAYKAYQQLERILLLYKASAFLLAVTALAILVKMFINFESEIRFHPLYGMHTEGLYFDFTALFVFLALFALTRTVANSC